MIDLVFYAIFAAVMFNIGIDLHTWIYQNKKIKCLEKKLNERMHKRITNEVFTYKGEECKVTDVLVNYSDVDTIISLMYVKKNKDGEFGNKKYRMNYSEYITTKSIKYD
jgi:hypothetical protein